MIKELHEISPGGESQGVNQLSQRTEKDDTHADKELAHDRRVEILERDQGPHDSLLAEALLLVYTLFTIKNNY